MRTTLSGYYRNLQFDQNNIAKELFDVTKQISSGQKIQYAYEDSSTFVDAVRLDNEVTTLTQVKQNSLKALQFSTNTDTTMNDMTKILDSMKVKMVSAATESHSPESLNAIASELRGLERNLIELANTSIDGKYLFSGSQINTKPIDGNGIYQGNGEAIKAFIGSGVEQAYNISGADLFLGEEGDTQRKVTLNMPHLNQALLYPDVMTDPAISRNLATEEYIDQNSTIRELMGDTDTVIDTANAQHHFYIRGTNHEGAAFKQTLSMRDDESVDDLLTAIGASFGNTSVNKLVDISINKEGQIEIEDKRAGSSKLDFHMVANTDLAGPVTNIEDLNIGGSSVVSFMQSDYTQYVNRIDQRQDLYDPDSFSIAGDFITHDGNPAGGPTLLSDVLRSDVASISFGGVGSTGLAPAPLSFAVAPASTMQDLINAIDTAYDPAGTLSFSLKDGVIVFDRQNGTAPLIDIQLSANDAAVNPVDGLPSDSAVAFDEAQFLQDGNKLLANVSQIVKADNSYANAGTKLVDVSTQNTLLGASSLAMSGIDQNGARFDVSFDFNSPVTYDFSLNGVAVGTFNIYDADTARTPTQPDDVTYQQLLDVVNMTLTGTARTGNTAADYDTDIISASNRGITTLDHQGKIVFEEINTTDTRVQFSMADATASDMTVATGSVLNFQSNNALEISDAKTDFFQQIDEAISSVELGRIRADGSLGNARNGGVQNAIQALDDLSEHLFTQHSVAGVQSQTLITTQERTELLIVNTQTIRSETLDVDIAEASLQLKQLELNYQAMLSTVSRISQLSLVNYL